MKREDENAGYGRGGKTGSTGRERGVIPAKSCAPANHLLIRVIAHRAPTVHIKPTIINDAVRAFARIFARIIDNDTLSRDPSGTGAGKNTSASVNAAARSLAIEGSLT